MPSPRSRRGAGIRAANRAPGGLLDKAAIATMPVPVVGDAVGLLSDAAAFIDEPSVGNAAMGLLGAVPFVPAGAVKRAADAATYRIPHRPMSVDQGAVRLHDLEPAFGRDIYGRQAKQFFGSGMEGEDDVLRLMRQVKNNPDAEVSVFRAVPKDAPNEINPGDWIGLDRKSVGLLAESEMANTGVPQKILEMKVKARDVTSWPDSLLEFGYYPE